jgi:hypothetical protein
MRNAECGISSKLNAQRSIDMLDSIFQSEVLETLDIILNDFFKANRIFDLSSPTIAYCTIHINILF